VHVAVDVDAGLVQGGAGLGIVDRQGHDGPALVAFADFLESGQGRIGLGQGGHGGVDLVQRIVMIEAQGHADFIFLGRQGEGQEAQDKGQTDDLFHFAPPRETERASRQAVWVSAFTSTVTGLSDWTIQVAVWTARP
jgi:hypothetical protein